jgi:hypothetical protein
MIHGRKRRAIDDDPAELTGLKREPAMANRFDHQRRAVPALCLDSRDAPRVSQPDKWFEDPNPDEHENEPSTGQREQNPLDPIVHVVSDFLNMGQGQNHNGYRQRAVRQLPSFMP